MQDLLFKKCFNHENREAAAQCPECKRFFCRECVTEHSGRVLCASCLGSSGHDGGKKFFRFDKPALLVKFFFGLFFIWICFYYIAFFLISLPSDFHEGVLWQNKWWN